MSNDFRAANKELDRLESSYKLLDPQSAPSEFARIVEEELQRAGLKLAEARQMNRAQDDALRKRIFDAAAQFRASRPESHPNGFVPCAANEKTIFDYMQANNLGFTDPTAYEQAFQKTHAKLIPPAARRAAEEVRRLNIGGKEIEISHESLDSLSARELERLLQNPQAVEAIDALPPRSQ